MMNCLGRMLTGSKDWRRWETVETMYYMRHENPPIDCNPGQPRDTPFIKTINNEFLRGTLKCPKSLLAIL